MFGNLFNIHDVSVLSEKLRQGEGGMILRRLLAGGRTGHWDHTADRGRHWWEIPAVRRRWNLMITGDSETDYFTYFHARHIGGERRLSGLSIGCGTGHDELDLASKGYFGSIDAYDISPSRIEFARKRAAETPAGELIDFAVGDLFTIDMSRRAYDIVMVRQALHHLYPLESALERMLAALEPEGWFVFNEFVGPSRFQWTDEQLAAVNDHLGRLPERYRTRWKSGTVKRGVHRPGRLGIMLVDPTEARESSRIMPLIRSMTKVVEVRGFGGNVLQLLFKDIAHNFMREDEETLRLLELCFEAEDAFLARDGIDDDFVAGICSPLP